MIRSSNPDLRLAFGCGFGNDYALQRIGWTERSLQFERGSVPDRR